MFGIGWRKHVAQRRFLTGNFSSGCLRSTRSSRSLRGVSWTWTRTTTVAWRFCLSDVKMRRMLTRGRTVTVFGVDAQGTRSYKEFGDPARTCESGVAPPILPWEVAHVVEWRVRGLIPGQRGAPWMTAGMVLKPGACIASPPFRAAGVCGTLRLWPAGYWTDSQKRQKAALPPAADELAAGKFEGSHRPAQPPAHTSWCCLGVTDLPHGTRLKLRLFIGDAKSEVRDICWREGVTMAQLWAPPDSAPPASFLAGETLVVGAEIFANVDGSHWRPRPSTGQRARERLQQRPPIEDSSLVSGSVLLGRGQDAQPRPMVRAVSLPQLASYGRPSTSNL